MKIKVIFPVTSSGIVRDNQSLREKAAHGMAQVDVAGLSQGSESIETARDEAEAASPLLKAALEAEELGYDGIAIDCAADPALRVLKESVNIPVCGAGEASYLTAMAVCTRFSVICVMESTACLVRENILKYGLSKRNASVRSVNIPVTALRDGTSNTAEALFQEGQKAIKEDGAGAVVLGCTGMAGESRILEQRLGVPVIEPAEAAIQMLITLIVSGKKMSRRDFPYTKCV